MFFVFFLFHCFLVPLFGGPSRQGTSIGGPELWESGVSKKQNNNQTQTKKQDNFPEVFELGASAERVLKYCFLFFVVFFVSLFLFVFFVFHIFFWFLYLAAQADRGHQ